MEFQSKNLSSLLNSNKSIESYLSECTEYEKSNILEEAYQVDEGFGDWLKHKVAGAEKWMQNKGWSGNFFGMGQSAGGYNKADRDASRADIQGLGASLEGVPDDLKLENIKNQIFSIEPEFPNGKDKQKFLDCLEIVTTAYDKIKQLHSSGNLKTDVANAIIDSFRKFLHHNLDAELMGVYSHFNENKKYDSEKFLTELALIERRITGNVDDSSTMQNLSSTFLPDVLNKIGKILGVSALAAYMAGALGDQLIERFGEYLENDANNTITTTTTTPGSTSTISLPPKNVTISGGERGFIDLAKKIMNESMPHKKGTTWTVGELQAAMKDAPGLFNDLTKHCKNPTAALAQLQKISSGNPGANLDMVFQAFSQGGTNVYGPKAVFSLLPGKVNLTGTVNNLATKVISIAPKVVATTKVAGITSLKGSAMATKVGTGLKMAAPLAMPLAAGAGVALGGAALISYLRSKGLKDSRASSLRKTIELLQNVSGDVEPRRGGEGGFRGGSRQGYGREEVITSRDFIKQMTDLLVAKAGPTNPSAPPGTPRTSQMDPSEANRIARELKAEIDKLKGTGGIELPSYGPSLTEKHEETDSINDILSEVSGKKTKKSPGLITRTAIENLVIKFLAKGSSLPTPLSKKDLTKAIELAMNYSGAPEERETLRGGSTREDPINKKAFEGPVGNKIVGHIIAEMVGLRSREGGLKYPNMRLKREEYENLIKEVLTKLVENNAILKPRRLAEARIFVGNPKNSRWFEIALEIVKKNDLFKKGVAKPITPPTPTNPHPRIERSNPAQAVPFTEDLMKILIQNSLLAESKNDGENLIVERWGKLAGLLND